ncbi:hypothetical protein [Paenibacillus flagellatus]|uniref:Uncharacterized protein n=1 Tax=Paenibacillus flagellatus TaxID=2211139 RepID=A0A2V5K1E5_9BACL|nr:hypothetical protein [Paenibacillus flagellatus]PYI52979.1 hypothetical protein DLM86_18440 [Paenibacillus flagellatus]
MEPRSKEQLEQDLADALTEGEMAGSDPDEAALHRLSPRYEVRSQAERDPIVEETKAIRRMAKEVDDRYDDYMSRATGDADKGAGPSRTE